MATKRTEQILAREFRKTHSKRRTIAKANDEVRVVRSDFASALRVKKTKGRRLAATRFCVKNSRKKPEASKLKAIGGSIEVNVFLSKFALSADSESTYGSIATAILKVLPLDVVAEMSKECGVRP